MPDILIISEADLRRAVPLDLSAVDCTEGAFRALSEGGVEMPPIMSMEIAANNAEIDVKTAYMPGIDSFAVKMSTGFFNNPGLGLPTASGLMVLFSVKTGLVEAVLLDNGYLTDVRTAAAGAVAARHLAREDSKRAAIFGTGLQARLQLQALSLVRPIETAVVWGRDGQKASAMADEMSKVMKIEVSAAVDRENAVKGADIIVTTTPATEPILMADWLEPGQHVTAMGSDQTKKSELDPSCLSRADLYVADRVSQTEVLGELRAALSANLVGREKAIELGDLVSGRSEGRQSADEITIADLTGTGVQDTAIATLARSRAEASGLGAVFKS